eukprot:g6425.t1
MRRGSTNRGSHALKSKLPAAGALVVAENEALQLHCVKLERENRWLRTQLKEQGQGRVVGARALGGSGAGTGGQDAAALPEAEGAGGGGPQGSWVAGTAASTAVPAPAAGGAAASMGTAGLPPAMLPDSVQRRLELLEQEHSQLADRLALVAPAVPVVAALTALMALPMMAPARPLPPRRAANMQLV